MMAEAREVQKGGLSAQGWVHSWVLRWAPKMEIGWVCGSDVSTVSLLDAWLVKKWENAKVAERESDSLLETARTKA